jgi:hypothetical protein
MPLFNQLKDVMAPIPGTAPIFAGDVNADLRRVVASLAPWCLDHHLPPRPPTKGEKHPPAQDLSVDPDTDQEPGDGTVDAGDPGSHEQVPPPPDAPPDPPASSTHRRQRRQRPGEGKR